MIKNILVLSAVLLFVSSSARAQHSFGEAGKANRAAAASGFRDAVSVCEDAEKRNQFLGTQCYDLIEGKLFDPAAIEACTTLQFGRNDIVVMQCMNAIVSRVYTSDEIKKCKRQGDFLMSGCLQTAGKDYCTGKK